MNAIKTELKKWLSVLERNWKIVDSSFLQLSEDAHFKRYLKEYRGLERRRPVPAKDRVKIDSHAARIAEDLESVFSQVMAEVKASEVLANWKKEDIEHLLLEFEKAVNLALFYWVGNQDRNFQFRTVVHYCELQGNGLSLFECGGTEYFVSFSDDGLRFGTAESEHIPHLEPVSSASLSVSLRHLLADVNNLTAEEWGRAERTLFARIRTCQREICLLVDEWEHRNAILAVRFNLCRDDLRKHPSPQTEAAFQSSLEKMGLMRDHLAKWCLEAFCAFQGFISDLKQVDRLSKDTQAELEALDALLLSAMQKIFLPASVSRHRYEIKIAELSLRWVNERLRSHHDDVASLLMRDALRAALEPNQKPVLDSLLILDQKSHEWRLSFDPSGVLKSFCWLYSGSIHLSLSALFASAIAKKLNPDPLDSFWMMTLFGLVHMPETFGPTVQPSLQEKVDAGVYQTVDKETMLRLSQEMSDILDRVSVSTESEEYLKDVRARLNVWRESL